MHSRNNDDNVCYWLFHLLPAGCFAARSKQTAASVILRLHCTADDNRNTFSNISRYLSASVELVNAMICRTTTLTNSYVRRSSNEPVRLNSSLFKTPCGRNRLEINDPPSCSNRWNINSDKRPSTSDILHESRVVSFFSQYRRVDESTSWRRRSIAPKGLKMTNAGWTRSRQHKYCVIN